jgi:endonuclease VIII
MPEGDTVLVTAQRLHRALAGQRLLATDFRVPAFATADLSGHVVDRVDARGKHLLARTDAGVAVHSHLRMDGEWQVLAPGEPWRGPAHEVRAVLTTAEAVAVGFRLGVLELLTPDQEQAALAHLGPDVLGEDWDADEALRRLIADPSRPVHEAVQDQRVMAGPGNVYANEVCFLRGLHPTTRMGEVADPAGIVSLMRRVMWANRATGRQITTGDTRKGRQQWVYGRQGRPCLRCGTIVRREQQEAQDRVRYWCPNCQPAPAGAGPEAATAPRRSSSRPRPSGPSR